MAELKLGQLRYSLTDVPPSQTPRLTRSSERIATNLLSESLNLKFDRCAAHSGSINLIA